VDYGANLDPKAHSVGLLDYEDPSARSIACAAKAADALADRDDIDPAAIKADACE